MNGITTPFPNVHCGRETTAGAAHEAKDDRGQWLEAGLRSARRRRVLPLQGLPSKVRRVAAVRRQSFETFGVRSLDGRWRSILHVALGCDSDDLVEVLGVKGPKLRERQVQATVSKIPVVTTKGSESASSGRRRNCLFRSVSHQVYGDDKHHDSARECGGLHEFREALLPVARRGRRRRFDTYISKRRACLGRRARDPSFMRVDTAPASGPTTPAWTRERGRRAHFADFSCRRKGWKDAPSYYGGGHYDSLATIVTSSNPRRSCYANYSLQKAERARPMRTLLRLSPCRMRRPRNARPSSRLYPRRARPTTALLI